ncbi:MAG TPA: hypothetical protein VL382_03805 [Terriglobales bacterium]|nr:hypothetical protein [Terriglobales bacterium]
MLALRLVHLIESRSDLVAAKLLNLFLTEDKCSDLHKVPQEEIRDRTREICKNLSDWLTNKTEKEVEKRYMELGARRQAQGVRLSQVIWALDATREHIHDFLRAEGFMENTVELVGTMDLMGQLDRFFDLAIYYVAVGYEHAHEKQHEHGHKKGTLDIVASF